MSSDMMTLRGTRLPATRTMATMPSRMGPKLSCGRQTTLRKPNWDDGDSQEALRDERRKYFGRQTRGFGDDTITTTTSFSYAVRPVKTTRDDSGG